MKFNFAVRIACAVALASLNAATVVAQSTNEPPAITLDSMLNTRISTASKYLQTGAEAAASITILPHEEIRRLGFRNLQELLESVPGMYVGYDRNYTSLGTRGFGQPSDYNNRILLLIDGHTMNEPVWGSTAVGSDLPINLDAIDRVEVVRGPGSALYGTNAVFAVINVVMKTGEQLNGARINMRIGSGNERQASMAAGGPLGTRNAFSISALATKSDGRTLYFSEFDTPANNYGVVRGLDWESAGSVVGSLVTGDITTRFGYHARSKGVPTASYLRLFGDQRSRSDDQATWAELSGRRDFGVGYHALVRMYADHSHTRSAFPFSAAPTLFFGVQSDVAGAETMFMWDTNSRNRFTIGSEFRKAIHARYIEEDGAGGVSPKDMPYSIASIFAQDELQIATRLKLVGGLRFDRRLSRWQSFSPRVALIGTPDNATTVKLLFGDAYRAPSVGEADLATAYIRPDSALKAESAITVEIALERRVARSVLVGASLYRYGISNLIEPLTADTIVGVQNRNAAASHGHGIELSLHLQPTAALSVRTWYAAQQTLDDASREQLVNSPRQTMNVSAMYRIASPLHTGLVVQHQSGRRTIRGEPTPSFTRVDANVSYAPALFNRARWTAGSEFMLRANNVFDARYAFPGGFSHVQTSIEQDRRTLTLGFGLAY